MLHFSEGRFLHSYFTIYITERYEYLAIQVKEPYLGMLGPVRTG